MIPSPSDKASRRKACGSGRVLGDGRLIRVRLPLAGNADAHIKSAIQRAVTQLGRLPRAKTGAGRC